MGPNPQNLVRCAMHRLCTLAAIAIVISLFPFAASGHVIPDNEICVTIPDLDGDSRYRDEVVNFGMSFVPPNAATYDDASGFQCYRDEYIEELDAQFTKLVTDLLDCMEAQARAQAQNSCGTAADDLREITIQSGISAQCALTASLGLPVPEQCAKYGY